MVNNFNNTKIQGNEASEQTAQPPSTEMLQKIAEFRQHLQSSFGKVSLALMTLPRYRHLNIGELQQLVLDPLLHDRIAFAFTESKEEGQDMAGFAIWASVSEETNTRLLEQVSAGVFPIRLKPEDWQSGDIHWLLDVVAPNKQVTTAVISNFNKLVKGGSLRLHPQVARLLDPEVLEKMGAEKLDAYSKGPEVV